jgi:hypothetical protein
MDRRFRWWLQQYYSNNVSHFNYIFCGPRICSLYDPRYPPNTTWKKTPLKQGCTNSGCKVAAATTFCTVAPNISGPQYGTCFTPSYGAKRFEVAPSRFFGHLWIPALKHSDMYTCVITCFRIAGLCIYPTHDFRNKNDGFPQQHRMSDLGERGHCGSENWICIYVTFISILYWKGLK